MSGIKRYGEGNNIQGLDQFLSPTKTAGAKEGESSIKKQLSSKVARIGQYFKTLCSKGDREWVDNNFILNQARKKINQLKTDINDPSKRSHFTEDLIALSGLCQKLNESVSVKTLFFSNSTRKALDKLTNEVATLSNQFMVKESGIRENAIEALKVTREEAISQLKNLKKYLEEEASVPKKEEIDFTEMPTVELIKMVNDEIKGIGIWETVQIGNIHQDLQPYKNQLTALSKRLTKERVSDSADRELISKAKEEKALESLKSMREPRQIESERSSETPPPLPAVSSKAESEPVDIGKEKEAPKLDKKQATINRVKEAVKEHRAGSAEETREPNIDDYPELADFVKLQKINNIPKKEREEAFINTNSLLQFIEKNELLAKKDFDTISKIISGTEGRRKNDSAATNIIEEFNKAYKFEDVLPLMRDFAKMIRKVIAPPRQALKRQDHVEEPIVKTVVKSEQAKRAAEPAKSEAMGEERMVTAADSSGKQVGFSRAQVRNKLQGFLEKMVNHYDSKMSDFLKVRFGQPKEWLESLKKFNTDESSDKFIKASRKIVADLLKIDKEVGKGLGHLLMTEDDGRIKEQLEIASKQIDRAQKQIESGGSVRETEQFQKGLLEAPAPLSAAQEKQIKSMIKDQMGELFTLVQKFDFDRNELDKAGVFDKNYEEVGLKEIYADLYMVNNLVKAANEKIDSDRENNRLQGFDGWKEEFKYIEDLIDKISINLEKLSPEEELPAVHQGPKVHKALEVPEKPVSASKLGGKEDDELIGRAVSENDMELGKQLRGTRLNKDFEKGEIVIRYIHTKERYSHAKENAPYEYVRVAEPSKIGEEFIKLEISPGLTESRRRSDVYVYVRPPQVEPKESPEVSKTPPEQPEGEEELPTVHKGPVVHKAPDVPKEPVFAPPPKSEATNVHSEDIPVGKPSVVLGSPVPIYGKDLEKLKDEINRNTNPTAFKKGDIIVRYSRTEKKFLYAKVVITSDASDSHIKLEISPGRYSNQPKDYVFKESAVKLSPEQPEAEEESSLVTFHMPKFGDHEKLIEELELRKSERVAVRQLPMRGIGGPKKKMPRVTITKAERIEKERELAKLEFLSVAKKAMNLIRKQDILYGDDLDDFNDLEAMLYPLTSSTPSETFSRSAEDVFDALSEINLEHLAEPASTRLNELMEAMSEQLPKLKKFVEPEKKPLEVAKPITPEAEPVQVAVRQETHKEVGTKINEGFRLIFKKAIDFATDKKILKSLPSTDLEMIGDTISEFYRGNAESALNRFIENTSILAGKNLNKKDHKTWERLKDSMEKQLGRIKAHEAVDPKELELSPKQPEKEGTSSAEANLSIESQASKKLEAPVEVIVEVQKAEKLPEKRTITNQELRDYIEEAFTFAVKNRVLQGKDADLEIRKLDVNDPNFNRAARKAMDAFEQRFNSIITKLVMTEDVYVKFVGFIDGMKKKFGINPEREKEIRKVIKDGIKELVSTALGKNNSGANVDKFLKRGERAKLNELAEEDYDLMTPEEIEEKLTDINGLLTNIGSRMPPNEELSNTLIDIASFVQENIDELAGGEEV